MRTKIVTSKLRMWSEKGAFETRGKQLALAPDSTFTGSQDGSGHIQNSVVKCPMKCINYISIWSPCKALFVCKKTKQKHFCKLSNSVNSRKRLLLLHKIPLDMIVLWTTSETSRWNYLTGSEKKATEHPSQSAITPIPSINTPITHAERRQCKQCGARRCGFLAAVAPLWLVGSIAGGIWCYRRRGEAYWLEDNQSQAGLVLFNNSKEGFGVRFLQIGGVMYF